MSHENGTIFTNSRGNPRIHDPWPTVHALLLPASVADANHSIPGVAPASRDTVPLGLMLVVLIEVGMPIRAVTDTSGAKKQMR